MQPTFGREGYNLLFGESIYLLTTNDELQKFITIRFKVMVEAGKSSEEALFCIRCENIETSQWSYMIDQCTVWSFRRKFLTNVPHDKVKNWVITKTATHLNVTCNKVTVLNFNFATDCDADKSDGVNMWSRQVVSFRLVHEPYNSLFMRSDMKC